MIDGFRIEETTRCQRVHLILIQGQENISIQGLVPERHFSHRFFFRRYQVLPEPPRGVTAHLEHEGTVLPFTRQALAIHFNTPPLEIAYLAGSPEVFHGQRLTGNP
ncbi:MAG: hypothetical protein BWY09_00768 [Candidatus Hydrogenedentes bacterium ADurb.Bin179]|nr:MAG: hypothetical protein BWY09_00768 [Candidatus Hydrogenedentes bacterium ADurb.Bin179]